MKLNVKILGGVDCEVEAEPQDTVDRLKAEVEAKLQLAKADQKLLFRGKTLQDGTPLSDYKLTEGSKINLVVKHEAATASACSSTCDLKQELLKVLPPLIKSDVDAHKVADAFQKKFLELLSHLSLDDWERIIQYYNNTRTIEF